MRRPIPSVCQPPHPRRDPEHPSCLQRRGSSNTRGPRIPVNRKRRSTCFTRKVRRRLGSYASFLLVEFHLLSHELCFALSLRERETDRQRQRQTDRNRQTDRL